jgi:replicative DNA helicase
MMLEPEAISIASSVLGADDFYKPAHAHIFDAIHTLYAAGQPADPVTVADELRRAGLLDAVGGHAALAQIMSSTPVTTNAARYARIVEEHALLRRLIGVAGEISELGYSLPEDVPKALDRAESLVYEVNQKRVTDSTSQISELLSANLDRLEELFERKDRITGVPTGYVDLDELLSGLQPSSLIIVGARPAMGKCVAWDTLIVDPATGARRTAAEMHRAGASAAPVTVLALDDDHQLTIKAPSAFVDDGHKPVFRVRTESGREVRTTLSHPFLTPAGWQPLGALSAGDAVAVPGVIPVFGFDPLPEAELLGEACGALDGTTPGVPERVFRAPRSDVARFLGAFLADRVELLVPSARLAHDVQHLLLRFGVCATVRRASAGSYELAVPDADDLERLECVVRRAETAHVLAPIGARGTTALTEPSAVRWDAIITIESEGDEQVYDLTVPDLHNFVADDVFVHNTSFALGAAAHAAIHANLPVLIFSLEMASLELSQRLLCAEARIDSSKVRNGRLTQDDWSRVSGAMGRLSTAPIWIDDNPNTSIMEIRAKARRLRSQVGSLGMVVVDYLQLMTGRTTAENRQVEVAEISRGLKILAREIETPVVALSQLSRNLELRADKRPMLADLRESGSLEQDSDVVVFIYRDEVYNHESPDRGQAEIIVAKHRNGPTGITRLAFLEHYTRFANMSRNV